MQSTWRTKAAGGRHQAETIARLEDEFGRTGAATVGPGVFAELRGRDDLAVDLQRHGVVVDLS